MIGVMPTSALRRIRTHIIGPPEGMATAICARSTRLAWPSNRGDPDPTGTAEPRPPVLCGSDCPGAADALFKRDPAIADVICQEGQIEQRNAVCELELVDVCDLALW